MKNQKLFMYGMLANVVQFVGGILISFSLFLYLYSLFQQSGWLFGTGVLFSISGIVVIIKGKAMRFDYKRRSGYIVHQGDN